VTAVDVDAEGVAVIGLACRLPGAATAEQFWANLRDGRDVTTLLSDEDLLAAGVPQTVVDQPNYVKSALVIEGIDRFDAAFFDVSPSEAQVLDPQQRLFLQCSWHALEDAGYPPSSSPQATGVFASTSVGSYQLHNLASHPLMRNSRYGIDLGSLQVMFGNAPDFLATRVSYKLNLAGPSATIQCACSSSLVAVHEACQSLLNDECDLALAGGVSIKVPHRVGYFYEEGSILSPDGRCRAFDAAAAGTVFGSGVGVVVLKRLRDAVADRDHIYAVVRGTAVNNDAAMKAGYTAPSVEAQSQVIAEALEIAGVPADSVTYVETHGTGTHLGDPIEIAALTRAFHRHTAGTHYCAIGSVKTNVGHLDVAAGVTGLIKTSLALRHGLIPASLNYERPNPEIDFPSTPFYVNTQLSEWRSAGPRRAGVTSLGVGGTNVHVVLEEAPARPARRPGRQVHLLTFSAKTPGALERETAAIATHLHEHPDDDIGDLAFTLHRGRTEFPHRRALLAHDLAEAGAALGAAAPQRLWAGTAGPTPPGVVFAFPGQGAQHLDMGKDTYAHEPVFRAALDQCAGVLAPYLGLDLRDELYRDPSREPAPDRLRQTRLAQPALFSTEYALGRLWQSWGIQPVGLIGHSIGEYAAACLAGVFTLQEALAIVAERGRLMQSMAPGAMLSVHLPEAELRPFLPPTGEVALAASNEPGSNVVSGTFAAVAQLERSLTAEGVTWQRLRTSHAFHSAMMDPVLMPFRDVVARAELREPLIPFVSSLTGTWIRAEDAVSPDYWAEQLRRPVRFAAGVAAALQAPHAVLLEVGPGRTLTSLARRQLPVRSANRLFTTLPHPDEAISDLDVVHATLGKLWLNGATVDWERYHADEPVGRIPLPGYPFEATRYWYEPVRTDGTRTESPAVDLGVSAVPAAAGERYERPALPTAYVEPGTPIEAELVDLVRAVLGIESVGINDNFFDLGLDSVMAVQVAARGAARGMALTPKQLFHHQSVAALATAIVQCQARPPQEDDRPGPVPLTSFQAWVLAHDGERARRWAQVAFLVARSPLRPALVQATLAVLSRRHSAFRLRFTAEQEGWRQDALDDDTPLPFRVVPGSACPAELLGSAVEEAITQEGDLLSLRGGALCRVVLLQGEGTGPDRLLILLHHLVADDLSLNVLLGEFDATYRQLEVGAPVSLPPRTTSFTAWANAPHHQAVARSRARDQLSPAIERRVRALGCADTVRRLHRTDQDYRVSTDDVLLTALLLTLAERAGRSTFLVRSPGGARDARTADVDTSCSVGAFAPLRSLSIAVLPGEEPLAPLQRVKDLRRSESLSPSEDEDPADGILFHFSRSHPLSADALLQVETTTDVPQVSAALGHPLEVWLTADEDTVRSTWFFDSQHYSEPAIDVIVDSFATSVERLLDACAGAGRALYSPTDFPDAGLVQSDLDSLLQEFGMS